MDSSTVSKHGVRCRAPNTRSGQSMVEYALILAFIALVVIVIVSVLGTQVSNLYSNVSSALPQ